MSEPKDPTTFNAPERETLNNLDVAALGQAVMTLTKEIWVLTDRQRVMEAVLAQKGMDISKEIKTFQPDADMQAELKQEGSALIERVLGSLSKG